MFFMIKNGLKAFLFSFDDLRGKCSKDKKLRFFVALGRYILLAVIITIAVSVLSTWLLYGFL